MAIKVYLSADICLWSSHVIYAKLSEAISEIKNGAPVADAEEFIKGLMNSPFQRNNFYQRNAFLH